MPSWSGRCMMVLYLSSSSSIRLHYHHHCTTLGPLSRGVWHCITRYITHTHYGDTAWQRTWHVMTQPQFHKITVCTVYSVQLPVSGLTPVQTSQAAPAPWSWSSLTRRQSVQASPEWHNLWRDIGDQLTGEHHVSKQIISQPGCLFISR